MRGLLHLGYVYAHGVKNVIHVMLENRAFDTVFGFLNHTTDIENLVGKDPICNYVNANDPTSAKACTGPNLPSKSQYDPDHQYYATTNEIYGTNDPNVPLPPVAPMSGFVQQASIGALKGAPIQDLQQVMASFDPANIPIQATLAKEFTIFDKWFAAIPGPTQPNRVSAHCATSNGWYDNSKIIFGNNCRSIFEDLADAGLTWKAYYQENPPSIDCLSNLRFNSNIQSYSNFLSDAKSGNLPSYTFLEPNYGNLPQNKNTYTDGHSGSSSFANAEAFIKQIYETLRASPQWSSSLLLITYDEHGGFHDHVPPPKAPNPDGITVNDPNHPGVVYSFDRLGLRVPVTLISPWVPKGQVIHEPNGPQSDSQFSHASIPATLRSIFKLTSPALTKRESWSGNFESYLLDTPRTDCPTTLPSVVQF
ncbi:hypothetical protein HDV04_005907 [Boothiomyces sp. JEL0838]|nr:hypothetical protein HDV04_005907 [Boothiomyces sp. JEL0838]